MRKQKYKGRCEKRMISKSKEVCRFYNNLQSKYADKLELNKIAVRWPAKAVA